MTQKLAIVVLALSMSAVSANAMMGHRMMNKRMVVVCSGGQVAAKCMCASPSAPKAPNTRSAT